MKYLSSYLTYRKKILNSFIHSYNVVITLERWNKCLYDEDKIWERICETYYKYSYVNPKLIFT